MNMEDLIDRPIVGVLFIVSYMWETYTDERSSPCTKHFRPYKVPLCPLRE